MKAERQSTESTTKLNVLTNYFKEKEAQLQRQFDILGIFVVITDTKLQRKKVFFLIKIIDNKKQKNNGYKTYVYLQLFKESRI